MSEDLKQFWEKFQAKELAAALTLFEELDAEKKGEVFAALFQRSQYANTPHSVSVLVRELHEDKTFDDFHRAWFPPEKYVDTREEASQTFHHFFPAPIRVINATNMENSREIVSVGLHWLTDEQYAQMLENVAGEKNQARGRAIAEVAEKTRADVFRVESDDNLGRPF